jgi:hypothetical protein
MQIHVGDPLTRQLELLTWEVDGNDLDRGQSRR